MKRISIILMLFIMSMCPAVFAGENLIHGALLSRNNNGVNIQLNSDFNEDIKIVKENNESVYLDIKNAFLASDFKTQYGAKTEDLSVVSQQIGNKVRIYLKGENLNQINSGFISKKTRPAIDFKEIFIIVSGVLASLVAIKMGYGTIKLCNVQNEIRLKSSSELNRQLYGLYERKPDIAGSSTNPIRYVDFAQNKENKTEKIAI